MKIKLWVDDIRNAPDESWTVARTVTSAITALSKFEVTECSLDYDISHQVTVGGLSRPYPCEETFQAVAYFIGEKYQGSERDEYHHEYPKITLHTSNPVGAEKMKSILKEYGLDSEIKLTGMTNRLEMEI